MKIIGKIKMYLKHIIWSFKISERKYDKKALVEFDYMINNNEYIYEKEIAILSDLIKDNGIVIDIGANRGEYSYYLSKIAKKVYAFEPGLRAFNLLKQIKEKYKLKNVNIYRFAITNRNGKHTLIVPYFNRQSQLDSDNPIKGRKEIIAMSTLDSFIEYNKISQVDFIKCDTEGSELFVFKGAEKTIKKYKPTIIVEIADIHTKRFGYSGNDVMQYLVDIGYSAYYYNYINDTLNPITTISMKSDSHVWSKISDNLLNNNYVFIYN